MDKNISIDKINFDKYFRNTRTSKKKKNDIVVMFYSSAVFAKGKLKEEIVDLLSIEFNSVNKCLAKLFKFAYAPYFEGLKICKSIIKDYIDGMSKDDIINKEYPFVLQMFFFTREKYIPSNDKRWLVVSDEYRKNNKNIVTL